MRVQPPHMTCMSLAISRLWHVDFDDSSNLDCVQVTLHKIIWSVAESSAAMLPDRLIDRCFEDVFFYPPVKGWSMWYRTWEWRRETGYPEPIFEKVGHISLYFFHEKGCLGNWMLNVVVRKKSFFSLNNGSARSLEDDFAAETGSDITPQLKHRWEVWGALCGGTLMVMGFRASSLRSHDKNI